MSVAGVPLADTGADELAERRLQVIAEQAVGLRWQVLATALIIVATLWTSIPAPLLLGWLAAVVASRELRASALTRMARQRSTPIARRLRATVRWNLLIGACNGSAALFIAQLDTTLGAVLTMILVSWGAGAVTTSATVMPAFLAYAGMIFVPLAAMWLATGTWLGTGIAALVLMFFVVQTRFARQNRETFEESFAIRRENEALARDLVAESAALQAARDDAVLANHEKSRFLAAASHDLRQPLQAISLNSGEMVRLPLDGHARSVAADIQLGIEQLRSMLDALLDLSKLDSGGVAATVQRVRLDVLVAGVIKGFKAAAAARGIALRGDCPDGLTVQTDPTLLHQILANLLDNAIKFTAQGSVSVAVKVAAREVEVSVSDTGSGIAVEHHTLIFEDLVQLHPASPAAQQGHGLGLGIVRRAAALLDLHIDVDSTPGQGATFRWRLPRTASADETAAVSSIDWSLAGLRILVLDDDTMVRGAYANALVGAGATPLLAATLEAALPQAGRCDAAVVDWRLIGDADGFAAIARLREQRPGLPVVMVTGDAARSIADKAHRAGIALLRKPVDIATLGRALHTAVAAAASASASATATATATNADLTDTRTQAQTTTRTPIQAQGQGHAASGGEAEPTTP